MVQSMIQGIVVGFAVAVCFIYAAWTLMPQVLRKAIAAAALKPDALQRVLPKPLKTILMQAAQPQRGCGVGCHGCGGSGGGKLFAQGGPDSKPLVFQPRKQHH